MQNNIEIMKKACLMCDHSTCGYKTGCVIVKDDIVVMEAWNETLKGESYCQNGTCIREENDLGGGKHIDKVCSIHAEANAVAKAAAAGISLKGANVFVTTFPCLICSKLLTQCGIANLYYMVDYMGQNLGLPILKENNIGVHQITEQEVWY